MPPVQELHLLQVLEVALLVLPLLPLVLHVDHLMGVVLPVPSVQKLMEVALV